ncbi:dna polymerase delta binding protein [Stylonychia lemnae]|uniref:FACT complex subunit SSRP1 n=1 Tax=Stylonychia lemnae TaxID=5949 RepID=A0A078A977_STYLE|nr:dna polymerase delta binding protein [Stylonychia lemnae]|eukprot:CDW77358.1 dna polymerase delta binding protein [Stylonychia lemnae]
MTFMSNNQKTFVINYKDIALSNAYSTNEVTLELRNQDENSRQQDKYDMVGEIRFYVPNTDLDKKEIKKQKKDQDKEKMKDEGEENNESENEEEDDDEAQKVTPAQILNEKIIKAAGIGEFAGEVIASLPDLPMVIPRGKYSFNMYQTYLKLHGKTNNQKIMFKDIQRGFLLPKTDGIHITYILHLRTPLRQGQTL